MSKYWIIHTHEGNEFTSNWDTLEEFNARLDELTNDPGAKIVAFGVRGNGKAADRGTCPVCGRDMQLKKDGTLRHHGGPDGSGYLTPRAYRCSGSGQHPTTTEEN